jgi:4-hydroxy-tetrahydrodipicolinate synthase
VWIPLITPFTTAGDVDDVAIERLCHEYLDAGAVGIVALGTTGEPAALDHDERREVIAACSKACASRDAQLMVGTGTNSTRTTIAATHALAEVPAVNAALVVVPYYVRPSEAGIVEHYRAVAAATPVPVVAYNVPYRTGRGLGAAALLALAATPNIVGVKQAVGGIDTDTLEVLRDKPDSFHVLGGEDPFLFATMVLGGTGAIAASAHVCTERFVKMIDCALSGKVEDARAHHEKLLRVVMAGFAEPNPAVWKGVLNKQGRIASPAVRAPMTDASEAAIERCLAAIALAL